MAKKQSPPVANEPPPAYTVLARRYRPQQFSDLVGQEAAAQALVNALKTNRVAHAYLFTGARGVGKTSTARILAKALNCVHGPTPTPCDECSACKAITSGEDVDVLEIDGASNRGIDEVRGIRDNVQYRPAHSRYKIYIIDEVHMLTPQAFNALLKTLEEPPPHVKFIFATTEAQKIPITILSRCQRFDFGGITTARIVERLREIVAGERMQADDEALEIVARRAGGSMRDAQSLLDQLLAFGGERLTAETVHQLLGTAGDDRVLALAGAALARDPKGALDLLDRYVDEGLQIGELCDQLIAYWRDLMVLNCGGDEAKNLSLSIAPRNRELLLKQAQSLKLDTILAGLDLLNSAKTRMRGSNHGRTLIEMALVRLGRLDDLVSLAQLSQWLNQPGSVPPARPAATSVRATAPPEAVKKKTLSAGELPPCEENRADTTHVLRSLTNESLPEIWAEVLTQIGRMTASHYEKAAIPAISGPNALVLRFPARYTFESEYCQESNRVQRIEQSLRSITGQPWQLRIEVLGNAAAPVSTIPVETVPLPRSRLRRAEAEQEPLVKRAIDVLDAQVVQIDDGFGSAPTATGPTESDIEEM
jgi:DNA polymerase-3 subunit gamma/tau